MLCNFLVRGAKEIKTICKRKRASKLEWRGCLEGFQIVVRLKGCMSRIHSASDVHTFHSMITFRYG